VRFIFLAIYAITLATGTSLADMIVNGTPAQVAEYLPSGAVNPDFWARGYDLTSVGHDNETTLNGQWGTLIQTTGSVPIIVSASHYYPQGQATFTNAGGQRFSYTVGQSEVVPGTDLFMAQLTTQVDASIHTVAIAPSVQVGQTILSVGYLYRVGQNTVSIVGTGSNTFSWNYSPTTYLSDQLQAWDSGGPTFTEEANGDLALSGIHLYTGGSGINGISGDTNITTLVSGINVGLANMGLTETAVIYVTPPTPEPSSLCLAGIGLASWLAVKFRRGR
jgi:hypothetical protein